MFDTPGGDRQAGAVLAFQRKMSETLIDFGEPLLNALPDPTPIDQLQATVGMIVTVWNALVLASPAWQQPEHIERLRTLAASGYLPGPMKDALESLTRRRSERFGADVRAVADWTLEADGSGGYRFRCDARIPDSHFA